MKARWLPRSLINTPVRFTLATTEAIFRQQLKFLRVPRDQWPEFAPQGIGAQLAHLENADGEKCAVVTVSPVDGASGTEIASRIVHEAMHLWRWTREALGETDPSSEFEAYAMQNICEQLFEEYVRQTQ